MCKYKLLDFGDGRKLEKFSGLVVDRPAPAASPFRKKDKQSWPAADLIFEGPAVGQGSWRIQPDVDLQSWEIDAGFARFVLNPKPAGQVGLFPEQQQNWDWIQQQKPFLDNQDVLNLFGYTGASTLATARTGARVVHVDSAKNIVSVARTNAARSGLETSPIRWIVDDTKRFAERELRRGNKYAAVFLDPPSYGHGPKNERWKIDRDLLPLLQVIRQLLQDRFALLLTSHSPGFDEAKLIELIDCAGILNSDSVSVDAGPLTLVDQAGRRLPSGFFFRCLKK